MPAASTTVPSPADSARAPTVHHSPPRSGSRNGTTEERMGFTVASDRGTPPPTGGALSGDPLVPHVQAVADRDRHTGALRDSAGGHGGRELGAQNGPAGRPVGEAPGGRDPPQGEAVAGEEALRGDRVVARDVGAH